MGILRQYLVENFGLTAARAVLTQFGFAHGWRMAEAMQTEFNWEDDEQWRRAGPRIHNLSGLFMLQPGCEDPCTKSGARLLASYEAEQHLLHFGRADSPVCWTISGLISGYVSRTAGEEIYVLEDRCLGEGHAACHLLGRTRKGWGAERAEELEFFAPGRLEECLSVSLTRVTETLKAAEQKLLTMSVVSVDCQDSVGLAGEQKDTVKATVMLCYGYVTLYAPVDIITSRLEGSVMRNIVPQFASVKVSLSVVCMEFACSVLMYMKISGRKLTNLIVF